MGNKPNNSLVSIIIPVYNAGEFLLPCITSVRNQLYANLEIILVNDGSTDSSLDVCIAQRNEDERIIVIDKQNGGASSARNAGLDVMTGDYFMFVDADDTIAPEMVSEMLSCVGENIDLVESKLTGCGVKSPNKDVVIKEHTTKDLLKKLLFRRSNSSACAKLYRSKTFSGCRFKEGRQNEDMLYLVAVYLISTQAVSIEKEYYNYRYNPNSVTHSFNEKSLDVYYNAKEIFKQLSKYEEFAEGAEYNVNSKALDVGYLIRINRKVQDFRHCYDECKTIAKKEFWRIFFSRRYKWTYRIKLLVILSVV